MKTLLITLAVVLYAQFISCDPVTDVFQAIVSDTNTTLSKSSNDLSAIINAVNRSSILASQKYTAFQQYLIPKLQKPQQQRVNGYVAQLLAAQSQQNQTVCKENYTTLINFYTQIYSGYTGACANLRFIGLIRDSVTAVQSYVATEVQSFSDDLDTAQFGGNEYIPELISVSAKSISVIIDSVAINGWPRQAVTFKICLKAVDQEAQQSLAAGLKKITQCLQSGF